MYSTFGSHPCTVADVHAAAIYVVHQDDMLSTVYCSLIFFAGYCWFSCLISARDVVVSFSSGDLSLNVKNSVQLKVYLSQLATARSL